MLIDLEEGSGRALVMEIIESNHLFKRSKAKSLMRLEYVLSDVDARKRGEKLRLELTPREQCRHYVELNGGKATLVTRQDFDSSFDGSEFMDGPFMDDFGSGHGEPYKPNRQAYGKLKSGLLVYAELSESFQKKTEELFESMSE